MSFDHTNKSSGTGGRRGCHVVKFGIRAVHISKYLPHLVIEKTSMYTIKTLSHSVREKRCMFTLPHLVSEGEVNYEEAFT